MVSPRARAAAAWRGSWPVEAPQKTQIRFMRPRSIARARRRATALRRALAGVAPGRAPWHHAPVRLSKPRLLLRAALLLFLAGFMAWRAAETGRTAADPMLDPAGATALSRIALIEWILSGLAALTAAAALLSLRRRPPPGPP